MYKSIQAIALRSIRVGDSKVILSAWSPQVGRLSLLMPAGTGAESRRRRALTMAMSFFEGEVDIRPNTELYKIRDLKPMTPATSLSANPVKASVAMFLAEVLGILLRDTQPDPVLWDFMRQSVLFLDQADARQTAFFHLLFLFRLGQFLGIMPDTTTWAPGRVFDMQDAIFRDSAPGHSQYLEARPAHLLYILSQMDYTNVTRLTLTRQERGEALDAILAYYTLHHASLSSLKTLSVLRSL